MTIPAHHSNPSPSRSNAPFDWDDNRQVADLLFQKHATAVNSLFELYGSIAVTTWSTDQIIDRSFELVQSKFEGYEPFSGFPAASLPWEKIRDAVKACQKDRTLRPADAIFAVLENEPWRGATLPPVP